MADRSPEHRAEKARTAGGSLGRDGGLVSPIAELPWLMPEKVTIPDRVAGYLERPRLMEQVLPTARRVTVLKAPAGFGKTTLLAESCRGLKQDGAVVAWLTLDVEDAADVVDAYLAFALQEAGLDVLEEVDASNRKGAAIEHRTALLIPAVKRCGKPCVLAIDELERLTEPAGLQLLGSLLQWGPPNLHVAIACREIPVGLDIASLVYEGRATVLSEGHLRFSESEVAGFLGGNLSRREIATLTRESGGWPVALRILRNDGDRLLNDGREGADDIAENWVEARLCRGLSSSDRDLLLDIGLFEWMDAELLDEVFEETGLQSRIRAIPALGGLSDSVRGTNADAWRLHPVIREYCAKLRLRETPERFRSIHVRIARALARRGETIAAVRHAVMSGDSELGGAILERAGGLRLWLREGLARLQIADRLLSEQTLRERPRLALAHCVVLMMTGRIQEAKETHRRTVDRFGGPLGEELSEAFEFRVDACTVQGLLCLYGCEPLGSQMTRTLIAEIEHLLGMDELDPVTRASYENGICIVQNSKAEFEAALETAERAERCAGGNAYVKMLVDIQRGQVAMARGRVAEAVKFYAMAQRAARANLLRDVAPSTMAQILIRELDLERNRLARMGRVYRIPKALVRSGTPLGIYAAAAGVAVDLTLQRRGVDAALTRVDEMREYALEADLTSLTRYLAAERVSLLAWAGRVSESEHHWRLEGLPKTDDGCLDLRQQSWREMEAVSCARLRLLMERQEFDAGRRFAESLLSTTAKRGLRRTGMRGLALSVALEHKAGRFGEAVKNIGRFLRLFQETDYARPLVREPEACLPALQAWIDRGTSGPEKHAAIRLLSMLHQASEQSKMNVRLNRRELDVLHRLETQRDKEIAAALGLSVPGVRYHIQNIYAKLGVGDRNGAISLARADGILSDP